MMHGYRLFGGKLWLLINFCIFSLNLIRMFRLELPIRILMDVFRSKKGHSIKTKNRKGFPLRNMLVGRFCFE